MNKKKKFACNATKKEVENLVKYNSVNLNEVSIFFCVYFRGMSWWKERITLFKCINLNVGTRDHSKIKQYYGPMLSQRHITTENIK